MSSQRTTQECRQVSNLLSSLFAVWGWEWERVTSSPPRAPPPSTLGPVADPYPQYQQLQVSSGGVPTVLTAPLPACRDCGRPAEHRRAQQGGPWAVTLSILDGMLERARQDWPPLLMGLPGGSHKPRQADSGEELRGGCKAQSSESGRLWLQLRPPSHGLCSPASPSLGKQIDSSPGL